MTIVNCKKQQNRWFCGLRHCLLLSSEGKRAQVQFDDGTIASVAIIKCARMQKRVQPSRGADGKAIIEVKPVPRPRQTFGGGQLREYLGGGGYIYRRIEGCL